MKKSNPRKLLIVLAVFVGVIVVAGVIVHFWFIKNATSILRDVVSEQSDGRFDLKIDKLSVNYVHGRIDIKDFRLNILDSSKTKVKHTFTTSYFVLEISIITRLLLYK